MKEGRLGSTTDGIDDLIRAGYKLLKLMTYFTTGEVETRAWTVPVGATGLKLIPLFIPILKKNIFALKLLNGINCLRRSSFAKARENGWLRTEGKEYIVKDGDVIEFKI